MYIFSKMCDMDAWCILYLLKRLYVYVYILHKLVLYWFLLFWSHLLSLSSILSLVLNPTSNWLIVIEITLVLTCFWFSSHRTADQSTGLGHAFDSLWNFGWWRWQLGHWQIIIDGYIDLMADIDHNESKYYHQ